MSDKCPKCGAKFWRRTRDIEHWDCGSSGSPIHVHESIQCLRNQNAKLKMQLEIKEDACQGFIDGWGLARDKNVMLQATVDKLEKWASFVQCCARSGEQPMTREEFEAAEAAKTP